MNLLLICDAYPPMRTSAAVHMHDLANALCQKGCNVTILVPTPGSESLLDASAINGVTILRFDTLKTKDVRYIRRTIAEFLMPFLMYRKLKRSPSYTSHFDGIIWYSPTIFFGPLIRRLKLRFKCKSYLILRDLFPNWALDLGLIKKGPAYFALKLVEHFQYRSADIIGVQAPGNLSYFKSCYPHLLSRIEVLWTWISPVDSKFCTINICSTPLSGRKIFVYSGNMGVAQGMDILFDLAEKLQSYKDLGFIFVGRGSEVNRLRATVVARRLDNVLFFDEINSDEIPGLYAQCHFGLVALDPRHKTTNIPGKFLSYMQFSLPVLANINQGNDLVDLIRDEMIGKVSIDNSVDSLCRMALELVSDEYSDTGLRQRCRLLAHRIFSPNVAVSQIISALKC